MVVGRVQCCGRRGCKHLGQGRHPAAVEEEALRNGLSLGMTLIDTAEGYSNGRSEELIGRVIAGSLVLAPGQRWRREI
jgi:aryl-alcohol dehydrogenase-like predicted oxidoreductase